MNFSCLTADYELFTSYCWLWSVHILLLELNCSHFTAGWKFSHLTAICELLTSYWQVNCSHLTARWIVHILFISLQYLTTGWDGWYREVHGGTASQSHRRLWTLQTDATPRLRNLRVQRWPQESLHTEWGQRSENRLLADWLGYRQGNNLIFYF